MFKQQFIDQFAQQLGAIFKNNPLTDLEQNLKAILHATFDKLDLVSRNEFEVQQQVLANTRAKLEELEQKVLQLEKKAAS
jgi:hypothetical protein